MNVRVYIELTKLRPHWPTHTIQAIVERDDSLDIMCDPRTRSIDKAEALARRWDNAAMALTAFEPETY